MSIDKSIQFPANPKVGDVFCVQNSRVAAPKGWTFLGVNYNPRTDTACCMFRYVGVPKLQGRTLAEVCKEQAETIECQAAEVDRLQDTIEDRDIGILRLKEALRTEEARTATLEAMLESEQKKTGKLCGKIESLEDMLDRSSETVQKHYRTIQALNSALASKPDMEALQEAQDTIREREEEISSLKAMFEKSLESKQGIINQKCQEIAKLKGENAQLRTDLDRSRRAHHEAGMIIGSMPSDLVEASRDINSLRKAVGSLKAQVRQRDEMVVGLRAKVQECQIKAPHLFKVTLIPVHGVTP